MKKKTIDHIIPNVEDWPINLFGKSTRGDFVSQLNEFVLDEILDNHGSDLEPVLAKTVYLEKIRSTKNKWKVDPADEASYWKSLGKELGDISIAGGDQDQYLQLLKRIINRYNEEIVGNFSPKTYRFATKTLSVFFKRLLNTAAGRNHRRLWGNNHQLIERLKVYGEIDRIRHLFDKGTVIMVPTHFSNLDSVLIGYAMHAAVGLPAFSYGAGLNLYDSEIFGYFMNRLGAYRVDRRKKNPIYLECLTSMASFSIQKGVNNLFFPGGTRSRDGSMEDRLKLGLLGSAIEAQRNLVIEGKSEKVFVVPLVLGYHFVLEALFLIEQHLAKTGKEKYIRSKDQFKSYSKISRFIWNLFSEKSEITLSFGEPMDVMGNQVDENGVSKDGNGETIELKDYFMLDGEVDANTQRENVYTKILGDRILDSYKRNNVMLTSHLVAYTAFEMLKREYDGDLYSMMNMPLDQAIIPAHRLEENIAKMQVLLQQWESEGKIKLSPEMQWSPERIIKDGIANLGAYHIKKPLVLKKDQVKSDSIKLLYYYHNRIRIYDFDKQIDWNTSDNLTDALQSIKS